MGLGHGRPSTDVATPAYARAEQTESADAENQMLPVRILTPAGEVALEQQLPGSRTVRSVLQTLSDGRPGRLTLLHGTQVVPPSRKLSELNLTEKSSLYLVRKPTGTYTPWSDDGRDADHLAKCLVIGGAGAGKTSWMRACCGECFEEGYVPTVLVDFKILHLQSEDGPKLKILLWDPAGQELFRTDRFFRGMAGLMLVFSLHNRETFKEALRMFEDVDRGHFECCRRVCMVATHADIADPEVTEEEAAQLARQKGWPFFAVSNKIQVGVDEPLFAWLDLFLNDLAAQTS